jgi:hypothetical protein
MELAIDINVHNDYSPLPLWERVARREVTRRRGVCGSDHDRFEHATGIAEHFIIPEPKNTKPLIFQPSRAPFIAFAVSMLATVSLDNQILPQGCEVDNVGADHGLSSEFHPGEAMRTQMVPEPALGLGHVRTKGLCLIS